MRLRTTERDAEAGHHFVEDQQRAVPRAQRAQMLQIAGLRRNAVGVADHRLDDHRRHLRTNLVEQRGGALEVVEAQRGGQLAQPCGYAGRGRYAQGQHAAAGLDQKRVAMAVITAFELDDAIAPGGATRQAYRRQRRFGAGVDHAHHLAGGHQPGDGLRHRYFGCARCTEREPVADRLLDRFAHGGVVVPGNHRPPRAHVVDVAVVVDIEQIWAIGARHEEWLAADRLERPYRRVDAAG